MVITNIWISCFVYPFALVWVETVLPATSTNPSYRGWFHWFSLSFTKVIAEEILYQYFKNTGS
jgi:hypothetical protein